MTERQGVEIDYCPQCRGVWLDRGELDKIIERSARDPRDVPAQQHDREPYRQSHERREQDYRNPEQQHDPRHKKRKESFLSDLFDF